MNLAVARWEKWDEVKGEGEGAEGGGRAGSGVDILKYHDEKAARGPMGTTGRFSPVGSLHVVLQQMIHVCNAAERPLPC